jgi:hypothetical protein
VGSFYLRQKDDHIMDIIDTGIPKEETIKIFSLKKLAIAFLIGFCIEFTRRLFEPAYGPLDLLFILLFSIYYTAKYFLLVVIVGFSFYIPPLKNIWFNNKLPFMIALFIGIIFFLYGTLTAHHIYFDLHSPGAEADIYLDHFAMPGFILILFSLSFGPFMIFQSSITKT